jgi:selenocysteine lyase/cysteine desulfurase
MTSRRRFLGSIGLPAFAAAAGIPLFPPRLDAGSRLREVLATRHSDPRDAAYDEEFWGEIARSFTVDRSLVNLNNGGVSPSPAYVQDAMKRHLDYSNEAPVYTMWRILEPQREAVRERLAREWDVDAEEIALTRNASEGLQILQFGFDLEPGDEVLTTNQDYPRMLTTFRQRERREGIVLREFSIPVPAEDPAEIVRRFEAEITPRTRLILMCHVINLTGQILPVRDVVALGRRHGIPVIVDGAHALAHFDFRLSDLDCDYYAVSLHKWLFAPHGTGLLYVRREKIPELWPLQAAGPQLDSDIRKFEEIGTHPAANFVAIGEALSFHHTVGGERKEARLRYLRDYWAKRLVEHSNIRLHTSLEPEMSCAIATVEIVGVDTRALSDYLWDEHRIIVAPIMHDEFQGLRVTPNLYTTLEELDSFCEVMEHVANRGLPKSA